MINLPFFSSLCMSGKTGPDGAIIDEQNRCEFLMCIAMYNEDEEETRNTFHGIFESLAEFQKQGINSNQIGCIVIIDGMDAFYRTYESSNGLREYIKPMINFPGLQEYWGVEGDMSKTALTKIKESVNQALKFDIACEEFTMLNEFETLRTTFADEHAQAKRDG